MAAPTLTKEQAVEMQDALIAEYRKKSFQRRLREAWNAAGEDPLSQGRACLEVCLPVQGPIISKCGFPATQEGAAQALATLRPLGTEPDVAKRNVELVYLLNPVLQAAATPRLPPIGKVNALDAEPGEGPMWAVVGGGASGGIVVKAGRQLNSRELPFRLRRGARVEQLGLEGERLHYRRVRGDGPDFGWVSISFKGQPLLVQMGEDDD